MRIQVINLTLLTFAVAACKGQLNLHRPESEVPEAATEDAQVPVFSILSPTGTLTPKDSVSITWEAVDKAQSYNIQIATIANCSAGIVKEADITTNSYAFSGFRDGKTYYICLYVTLAGKQYRAANFSAQFNVSLPPLYLGQPNATTAVDDDGAASLSTIDNANSVFRIGEKLIVTDSANNRAMVWDAYPTTNNQPASFILGQPNTTAETSDTGGISAARMDYPYGIFSDGTALYIADSENNRTLGWSTFPTYTGQPADIILGQSTGTAFAPAAGATGMYDPRKVIIHKGKMFVADGLNHRILIWNTIPHNNTVSADVVLGQSTFAGNTANGGGGISNGVFNKVNGLDVSDTHLVATDRDNNRVMIWNGIPTTSAKPADVVLGQADFTVGAINRGGSVAANTLYMPLDARICDQTLYVADRMNHRILVWDTIPSQNGQPADAVIGQADFTSNTANRGGSVGADTLNEPYGISCDANRLYIADGKNFRVIIRSR